MLPILNLNKHPKDCKNLSLISANNVRLSNDGSCLQSENSIVHNETIRSFISSYYNSRFNIIKLIPCNTELIIITTPSGTAGETPYKACIFRYNERNDDIKLVYEDFDYYGGKINGTFTYNVNNELIVSIAEYDAKESVPLRTINFGKFEDNIEQLPNELLSVNPKVNIPTLDSYDYVPGNLPKGWYYVFIRYKIDNNDYTNWYPISDKIIISLLEKQNIIKYYGYNTLPYEKFVTGAYDHFNSDNDLSNSNIKINISSLDNDYKYYQIGCIHVAKDTTKAYISDDIIISKKDYVVSLNNMFEHDITDLIINTYTPYNVKNVINYQNRLYISNYDEKLLDNYDTSEIKLSLKKDKLKLYDIKKLQYIQTSGDSDWIEKEFSDTGIAEDLGVFEPIIVKDLEIEGVKTNTDLYENINLETFDEHNYSPTYKIKFTNNDIIIHDEYKTVQINRAFNIKSDLGFIKQIYFVAEFAHYGITNTEWPAYANIYFKYVDTENKEYYLKQHYYRPYYNENGEHYVEFKLYNGKTSYDKITKEVLNADEELNVDGNTITYINSKQSFEERTKATTLIPGEVYNFFIHFVDKYGQVTRGFKLQNNIDIEAKIPLDGFVITDDYGTETNYNGWYYMANPNDKIYDDIGEINIKDTDCVSVTTGSYYACLQPSYNHLLKDFLDSKYKGFKNIKNITWGQLPDLGIIDELSVYTNANGDKLFKIPYETINVKTDITNVLYYEAYINSLEISGIKLPEDYVGYFISYEKPNYLAKVTGFLTKYDASLDDSTRADFKLYNDEASQYMRFYSSDFDINDSIDLNYNVIRIEKKNAFNELNNFKKLSNGFVEYIANLNVPEEQEVEQSSVKYYYIKDFVIEAANDYVKDRFGLSTVLKIPIINELFPIDEINTYKATLMYIDENIYTNSDKTLIKCSNIIYDDSTPKFTFDGVISYNNFLIYNNNRFEFNQTNKVVYNKEKAKYYNEVQESESTVKFAHYIQMPVYNHYFYETKSFKNNPQNVIYPLDKVDDETEDDVSDYKLVTGTIVEPANTLDLFTNKYNIEDLNIKTYLNYREDVKYISHYSKFIRRSNIIQDESLSNAWRRFELENYKIISENKGEITNLVGIGTYLIVHTEHSIFVFNNDNVLKTQDQNIQLDMPDIFSMSYKELVTSELGHCGLQDSDANILGEFGYIFYDNDSYRIYKFDNGSVDVIDNDIVQFLKKYKPYRIRFAHDQYSNRILLNIEFDNNGNIEIKTLSYHYKTNNFISFHDYIFTEAVNTKNTLYLVRRGMSEVYNINYDEEVNNYVYNKFENGNGELRPSQLDIIINDNYNIIKYLECIIYKLYKIRSNAELSYENSPVEKRMVPYSGEQIRIYNDQVDTGWLDIKIDTEESKNVFDNYDKPHWDLGNWNFNYFRDSLSSSSSLDFVSRLYGNYFIISIIFGDSNERVEFESLGYNVTKDKRI